MILIKHPAVLKINANECRTAFLSVAWGFCVLLKVLLLSVNGLALSSWTWSCKEQPDILRLLFRGLTLWHYFYSLHCLQQLWIRDCQVNAGQDIHHVCTSSVGYRSSLLGGLYQLQSFILCQVIHLYLGCHTYYMYRRLSLLISDQLLKDICFLISHIAMHRIWQRPAADLQHPTSSMT